MQEAIENALKSEPYEVKPLKTVYLDPMYGDDSNFGNSEKEAVKTYEKTGPAGPAARAAGRHGRAAAGGLVAQIHPGPAAGRRGAAAARARRAHQRQRGRRLAGRAARRGAGARA